MTASLRSLLASLTIALHLFGCAANTSIPSSELRSRLGTIGVVPVRYDPKVGFQTFARGKGAGAKKGARQGALKGSAFFGRLLIHGGLLLPCLIPPITFICIGVAGASVGIGAVAGGVKGEKKAVSEATAKKIDVALEESMAILKFQEKMANVFLDSARKETRHKFVLMADEGPASPDEKIDYRTLAGKGVNTILELRVQSMDWKSGGGENPLLAFFMRAQTRLIRVSDGKELHVYRAGYRSRRPRKFTEWAADGARPFTEELTRAYGDLAKKLVDDLFLLNVDIGN